ncbi:hypothetical protein O9Z70_01290 [Devosia sp. YIM 151766]|uniref:GbsR/MarR family transcriptional regulator n=1 Tax=Devosia sp. YIM 151766 TaxID=3017325 RepID=UPI00255C87A8|nr:MarR family transcriptional regulator [Devosia sp. YIM 151766]WIY53208.1 hypothetical protein O9Z70_01290 [Devosia sp. YIM 151766]
MTQSRLAAENFIEQMGLIMQTDGGPRIAGRILGLLIVEGRSFSLAEMADRLKISKASASTNARLLANTGMIRQTSRAGDRQDYYELGEEPYSRMMETVTARMRKVANLVFEAEARFADDTSGARMRVRQLAQFYQQSADFITEWSAHSFSKTDASRNDAQPSTAGHDDH